MIHSPPTQPSLPRDPSLSIPSLLLAAATNAGQFRLAPAAMAGAQHSHDLPSLCYFVPSGQIRRSRPPSLTRDHSPVPRDSGGRRLRRRRDTGDLGWSSPSASSSVAGSGSGRSQAEADGGDLVEMVNLDLSVNDFNEDEVGARAASPLLCPAHSKLCMLYLISAQLPLLPSSVVKEDDAMDKVDAAAMDKVWLLL